LVATFANTTVLISIDSSWFIDMQLSIKGHQAYTASLALILQQAKLLKRHLLGGVFYFLKILILNLEIILFKDYILCIIFFMFLLIGVCKLSS
jgi:hypothetical protein